MVTKATAARKRTAQAKASPSPKAAADGPAAAAQAGANAAYEALKVAGVWIPDFTKLVEQLHVPGVDVDKLLAARRRDIEAVVAANKEVYAGFQSIAKRQAELAQETLGQWQASMMGGSTERVDETLTARAEIAQKAFAKALANLREIAEMASQTQARAFKLMQERSAENIEEMRQLMKTR